MTRAPQQNGFSLIEIVVAIAIVSFMAILIGESVRRTFIVRDKIAQKTEISQSLRAVNYSLTRDFRLAFYIQAPKKDPKKQGGFREKDFSRLKTFLKGTNKGVMFTSTSHRRIYADSPESELAIIEYRLEPSDEFPDANKLIRREKSIFDGKPDEGGAKYLLADNVEEISFEYYDGKNNDWKKDWDSTEGSLAGRFPTAVKVDLKLKQEGLEVALSTMTRIENPMITQKETKNGKSSGGK